MSGLSFTLTSPANSLTAATAQTVLQIIAPSTNKVKVGMACEDPEPIEVAFNGASPTDAPARVQIMRQTTAIGGSPTTVTPVKKVNGDAGTIQTTAKKSAGGSEPTSSDVYYDEYHHPQGRHPINLRRKIEQGDRLGVVITPSANVNCSVTAPCEE